MISIQDLYTQRWNNFKMLYYHEITFLFFLSSYESFDYNETCLYFPYIFPILFDILFTRAFEHVKNADQKSLRKFARGWYPRAFLAAIYDYHGRSWGGQLGPDPAGFKRRCRIGPWHRVSAKVSRYISISRRTIPTLSARRKTALSPRHSFCKHVCILGGMRISDVGWLRRVCTMHDVDIEHARHGTAKCAPRKTSASLSLLWSGFRFDPSHPRIW